jgi:hypothetical protein
VFFQVEEVVISGRLFAAILDRIQQFGVPPPATVVSPECHLL